MLCIHIAAYMQRKNPSGRSSSCDTVLLENGNAVKDEQQQATVDTETPHHIQKLAYRLSDAETSAQQQHTHIRRVAATFITVAAAEKTPGSTETTTNVTTNVSAFSDGREGLVRAAHGCLERRWSRGNY